MADLHEQRALIQHYIGHDPQSPGRPNAVLRGRRLHVWALVGYWQTVQGDVAKVADDYDVPIDAVRAALAFYEMNKEVIDARLEENDVDPDDESMFFRERGREPDSGSREHS